MCIVWKISSRCTYRKPFVETEFLEFNPLLRIDLQTAANKIAAFFRQAIFGPVVAVDHAQVSSVWEIPTQDHKQEDPEWPHCPRFPVVLAGHVILRRAVLSCAWRTEILFIVLIESLLFKNACDSQQWIPFHDASRELDSLRVLCEDPL